MYSSCGACQTEHKQTEHNQDELAELMHDAVRRHQVKHHLLMIWSMSGVLCTTSSMQSTSSSIIYRRL